MVKRIVKVGFRLCSVIMGECDEVSIGGAVILGNGLAGFHGGAVLVGNFIGSV